MSCRWQNVSPFGFDRGGRLGCTLSPPDKRLLDFGEFVAGVEGVVELLTVGCEGRRCGLTGGDACGEVRANVDVETGGIGVGIGGSRGSGGGLDYGGGMKTPRMMTMTPELAQSRLVRLAKVR